MEVLKVGGGGAKGVDLRERTEVICVPYDSRQCDKPEARNLMRAPKRVLDLPTTHIDARHPKYIALRPLPGATPSPGDT